MFGMDMALGGGMMDMGAMDMGIGAMDMRMGAMDMAMGRPLLGAEMMGMGARDMGMGAMEMNMGMGMMDRGMMGMGGFGMGYGMMDRGIGICAPGCMLACCRPVVVCPPGCTRSCCVSQQIIVRNVPNQYDENSGFVRLPPIQPNQRPQNYPQVQKQRQYEVTPNDVDIQQQMISQQVRLDRQKNDQILYRQKLQQEKLQLQREKLQFEQQQIQKQRNEQIRLQQMQNQQRYEQLRVQEKMGTLPQYKAERQASFAVDQNRIKANPYGIEIIYQGDIYLKNTQFAQWMQVKAQLTMNTFQECNIDGLHKIKIKNTRHAHNFRVIKLSFFGRADMFIALPYQEQSEWMCRIIWARLNSMNRPFNQCQIVNFNQNSNVYYEGEIIRKGFFSGWEPKYAVVSASGLIISNTKGGQITHHIKSVPQIWTRFDFIQGNMLIIKFHALGRKNQIGIPVEHGMPWLKALYTLTLP